MEAFVLPVLLNGKEVEFNARLINAGYVYKIEVDVDDAKLYFEKDDAGEWRALMSEEDMSKNKTLKKETVQAIAECIDALSR